eukprot:TRINITY_DN44252_c0_g1_i1.p2 TRINITY_DN44252_c0_g1~~TRINITY_DN44252_c0_g1_i1.p2  ORF type:complete len:226 (+),score=35.94 TRINITY_DN44252_c0_g1_i1:200-877(+)
MPSPLKKLEVYLASSTDPRFPQSNIVDGDQKTFWLSTGLFPQEVIIALGEGSSYNLSKIHIWTKGVKSLVAEKSTDPQASNWATLFDVSEMTVETGKMCQEEVHNISSSGVGAGVRFVKFTFKSGYSDFVSFHRIDIEGDIATRDATAAQVVSSTASASPTPAPPPVAAAATPKTLPKVAAKPVGKLAPAVKPGVKPAAPAKPVAKPAPAPKPPADDNDDEDFAG